MLQRFWRNAVRVVTVAAVVVCFLFVMELVRAYHTLRDIHPAAGYAFLVVLAVGGVWLTVRLLGGWRLRPRTLRPPDIADLGAARPHELRRYARYLVRYLRRLAGNESLSADRRARADAAAEELLGASRRLRGDGDLADECRRCEREAVEPLLAELDKLAVAQVTAAVRDVMVGVAASPWPIVDATIVLWCTGRMVTRVTHVYNSRPPLREQLIIFADTVRIVATIKLTFLLRKVVESLARSVPLMGRLAEAAAQAVVAGVLISAAGHAARHRCRAFRGWDRREAAADLKAHLGEFLRDCQRIATENLVGLLARLYHGSADRIAEGLGAAFEAVAEAAEALVRRPVAAGGRHVVRGLRWSLGRLRRLWGARAAEPP